MKIKVQICRTPAISVKFNNLIVNTESHVEPLFVTENGTYVSDIDGFQPVIVEVPSSHIDPDDIATDEEIEEILDKYFADRI